MLVTNRQEFEDAISILNSGGGVVDHDYETTGTRWHINEVCGVGLGIGEHRYYFPFRHGSGENLPVSWLPELHARVLPSERPRGGHHYSFDLKIGKKDGLAFPNRGTLDDSILAAHLMNENEQSFKMESIMEKYIQVGASAAEGQLIDTLVERFGGARKRSKGNLWRLSGAETHDYAVQDLASGQAMREFYAPYLKRDELYDLYKEICDYQLVLAHMELVGIPVDLARVDEFDRQGQEEISRLNKEAAELAGYAINLNSPKQVQAWLRIPSSKAEILDTLDSREAKIVKQYRLFSKASSAYYNKYRTLAHGGMLYPAFSIVDPYGAGTISGRLSCREPPMQALPRDIGKFPVKKVFVAPPGYWWVEIDIDQAEIVVMAHYSKDEKLIDILQSGTNMHDKVAADLNIKRQIAKQMNLSCQYGVGPKKFSERYGYTLEAATKYIGDWRAYFAGIWKFYTAAERTARRRGYVKMWDGRRRHYENGTVTPYYKASNNIVQGAVAAMIRVIMTRLHYEVPEFSQRMQTHDAVAGLVKEGDVETIRRAVEIFKHQPWCSLPINASAKVGPTLGDLQEMRFAA
jgi:DNA polymerase-1